MALSVPSVTSLQSVPCLKGFCGLLYSDTWSQKTDRNSLTSCPRPLQQTAERRLQQKPTALQHDCKSHIFIRNRAAKLSTNLFFLPFSSAAPIGLSKFSPLFCGPFGYTCVASPLFGYTCVAAPRTSWLSSCEQRTAVPSDRHVAVSLGDHPLPGSWPRAALFLWSSYQPGGWP